MHVLSGHRGRLNTVTVSSDGATLITASDDSTARVWDAASGDCRAVLEVRSVTFCDNRYVHCCAPIKSPQFEVLISHQRVDSYSGGLGLFKSQLSLQIMY